ncbi:hypothetical protein ACFCYN_19320 [Gottfriedia sp. NPDC056225]|uniref:hypothetical protein n=1 Tax=Gottfriedia sp. NPDC056225 TaxID=3345751 RepID=UPI0035DCF1DD
MKNLEKYFETFNLNQRTELDRNLEDIENDVYGNEEYRHNLKKIIIQINHS